MAAGSSLLSYGKFYTKPLDFKADAWRQCPGVQYVLCIRIGPELNVCQNRLHSIVNRQFEDSRKQPMNIDNNSGLVVDSRRLLGLPPGTNLPAGFNDPVQFNNIDAISCFWLPSNGTSGYGGQGNDIMQKSQGAMSRK
ncbi:uncharacterized protein PITG_14795 [Phytophthora infestans T30-4]|uniref:Uncharacterized protein n=1 Tax=Phytophthora infestans (strain T30-4) TaxID=403677 RepID=D0NP25_PHYIT|nr:uncharacterized protein PITG_14795 [Phytophthora infestans T30-4]EEY62367.1 hypothetical protein PITG_14795 [Phytophthora infestans T30-4]|eukprot:XP_002899003.1 hypothetical protein PITG_14795 [Phytophthora infestans T30-4]